MDNTVCRRTGAAGRAAIIGAVGLLAVGCGLQRVPHLGHPGHHAAHSPAPAAVACSPASVRVKLDLSSTGVAAGTSYLPIDFTNVSRDNCVLTGPPDVAVATGPGGRRVGAAAAVEGAAGEPLVLAAGGTAHVWLHLASAADLPAAACGPTKAAGFLVTLPGQARAVFVRHRLTTCARRVPGTDVLIIEPVRSGPARPGTAQ